MTSISHTRDVFLFCMSIIYLVAFASLYVQIPGLYGDNGILPAKLVLKTEGSSWDALLGGEGTLLKLTPQLGLTVQQGMDLLCVAGIVIAFFMVILAPMRHCLAFLLLWILYFSLYQIGQTFLWFQWDILLLEAGFLTVLLAPLCWGVGRVKMAPHHQHDAIILWLLRWLLFRLMFSSGVVKLTSRCPTWWQLTALSWHFESQCIPMPLAWYFHHLPAWFLQLSVVATYVIEIAVPFLFFAPVRALRLFSFWSQVLLQVLILVTGNYNFFNLLTLTLCVPLLDDQFFGYKNKQKGKSSLVNRIATVLALSYLCIETKKWFGLTLTQSYTIESHVSFSERQFDHFVAVVTPYTIYFAAFSLAFEVLVSLVRCFTEIKGVLWKNVAAIQCLVFALVAAAMFAVSLVPYSSLHNSVQKQVPVQVKTLHDRVAPYHLTSSYGLFRRMTGVGGRPEVVIEGSNSLEAGWREYEFLYKPGMLNRRPPIVAPHQPRLDWQMWFAALGSSQHNPWFLHLVYRLLTNELDVLDLIDYNPFPEKPPTYIRAQLYKYHYTPNNNSRKSKTDWWSRELTAEYLRPVSKDEPNFVNYLKKTGIVQGGKKGRSKKELGLCAVLLEWLRACVGQPEGFVFVSTLLLTALTTNYIFKTLMS